ncbi:MAG: DUF192 domain-containing protein [Candidatus Micrarchaeota archaeon]
MKTNEIAVLAAFAILLILIIFFITAKGEKRRVTLINAEGARFPIDVEIANNSLTRAKGLMGRQTLGENEGMLFIFDKSGIYPFWMLNTTIPLDAVYIAENGSIVDIIEMEPCGLNITKCRLYTPKAEARYVLEVNRGFSARLGVSVAKGRLVVETIK